MASLKPHQLDLLKLLVERRSPVPVSELDGRVLRSLRSAELIAEFSGRVLPTEAGIVAAREAEADSEFEQRSSSAPAPLGPLSSRQEEVLRDLFRQTEPVLADHIDGRVLRALDARGLIVWERGWVRAAPDARSRLGRSESTRKRRGRGAAEPASSARATSILRVVEQLESLLPRGVELKIGDMPASADDVLIGLRRLAQRLQGRGQPQD